MLIGKYPDDSENATLDPSGLCEHVGILGNSGSGKTVMAKIILEECTLAGIPSIILDVQGDLARMALPTENDPKADSKRQSKWNKASEVRIWTPISESGLPICLSPFKVPPNDLSDDDDREEAWERMAVGITEILGYDISKKTGGNVRAFLFSLLVSLADENSLPSDFGKLAKSIARVDRDEYSDLIKPSDLENLVRAANSFHTGPQSRLFTQGTSLSIPLMLEPRIDGRTPVNVLYLNTLTDESRKMSFIAQFYRELYDWALQNPPKSEHPQVMVFLDEAGSFIPPDPRMPSSKQNIQNLLKRGRKFGIGCMLASQSLGDLDYKTVGQTSTTFLGRFTAPQDINKVGQMLKGMQSDVAISTRLAKLRPGQFLMVDRNSDDIRVQRVDTRWLLTSHGAPLTIEELPDLITKASRDWAKAYSEKSAPKRAKITKKLRESARPQKSRASGEQTSTGTPILGGFTHLADGSDPLHVLMGVTHAVTALTLLLCTYTLGNLWAEGEISQLPFIVSAAVSALMGLGLALDFILRNESGLSKKIRSKARRLEGLVLLWVWTLWGMEATGAMDLSEWAFMILISQTLLTAFFALEVYHRVRLGRLELVGETIVDKLKSGVRGIPVILTGAEVEELRATSEQIHDGLRTFMEVATVGLLVALMTAEIDLDTAWVSELAVRIASLDVALLLSKAIASREKRL